MCGKSSGSHTYYTYIAYRGEETSEIKIERSQCVLCACKMCNLFTDI